MNTTLETVNHFIDWTQIKMTLDHLPITTFPRKKEIWWASLGQNVGVEMNGKSNKFERPVLVISAFNADSFLIAPITSKVKEHKFLPKFISSTGAINSVSVSQLRTVSVKRFNRKIADMSQEDFDRILKIIHDQVCKEETPQSGASSDPQKEV